MAEDAAVRSVEMEGAGTLLVWNDRRFPVAGTLSIRRRALFSPWSDRDAGEGAAAIDMAWGLLPEEMP